MEYNAANQPRVFNTAAELVLLGRVAL